MRDRRRTEYEPGRSANFLLLEPDPLPPIERITSVAVVPFTPDGKIVAAVLERGVDLPGGHIQDGESTIDEAARREALEEAGIELRDLVPVKVVQSDYYGSRPEDLTYMVMLAGLVAAFNEFVPSLESKGRLVVTVEEFLARYSAGDRRWMQGIIEAAQVRLFAGVPSGPSGCRSASP